jgi:hypothetical protein
MTERKVADGNDVSDDGFDVDGLFALASRRPTNVAPEYRQRVEAFVDFVGCVLGIVLSERQIEWLRVHTAKALAEPESDAAELIEASIRAFQAVKDADHQTRFEWREENQPRFVAWIAESTDALSPTLHEWHEAAREVLADGRPPLTREAAESWAELSTFASRIVQGEEPDTAEPEDLEGMIDQLAGQYQALHPQEQLRIAFAPIALYEIRRGWPTMSRAERTVLRNTLASQFNLQSEPAAPREELTAWTSSPSGQPRGAASGWDRFRDDSSVESLQRQLAEALERKDRRRANELQAKIQDALHRAEEAAATLTNLSAARHRSLMKVADNLKF